MLSRANYFKTKMLRLFLLFLLLQPRGESGVAVGAGVRVGVEDGNHRYLDVLQTESQNLCSSVVDEFLPPSPRNRRP